MLTFYSEASTLVNYIAEREGGFDKLKGKKIATVYHDSAYGREPWPAEIVGREIRLRKYPDSGG